MGAVCLLWYERAEQWCDGHQPRDASFRLPQIFLPKQETIESLSQFLREALTRQSGVMVEGFVHMTILLFFVVVVFFIKSRVATWTIPHHHISQPAKSQSPLHSIFLLVNISSILTTI